MKSGQNLELIRRDIQVGPQSNIYYEEVWGRRVVGTITGKNNMGHVLDEVCSGSEDIIAATIISGVKP